MKLMTANVNTCSLFYIVAEQIDFLAVPNATSTLKNYINFRKDNRSKTVMNKLE